VLLSQFFECDLTGVEGPAYKKRQYTIRALYASPQQVLWRRQLTLGKRNVHPLGLTLQIYKYQV